MNGIRKTFKREVAVMALAFWAGVTAYLTWWAAPERIAALDPVYFAQTWATWGYAAAAFGLHALATQWGQK